MTDRELEQYRRAIHILSRMSLERVGWRSFFQRWKYSHEPLRHDAANLLVEIGYEPIYPMDSRPLTSSPEDSHDR